MPLLLFTWLPIEGRFRVVSSVSRQKCESFLSPYQPSSSITFLLLIRARAICGLGWKSSTEEPSNVEAFICTSLLNWGALFEWGSSWKPSNPSFGCIDETEGEQAMTGFSYRGTLASPGHSWTQDLQRRPRALSHWLCCGWMQTFSSARVLGCVCLCLCLHHCLREGGNVASSVLSTWAELTLTSLSSWLG